MGKLARLNAQGLLKKHTEWMIVLKNDFSYEVAEYANKEDEDKGKKTNRKVENILFIPMGSGSGHILPFKNKDEADSWISELIKTATEAEVSKLIEVDFRLLEVKYVPQQRKMYSNEWYKTNVITDIKVDMKTKRPSKLL